MKKSYLLVLSFLLLTAAPLFSQCILISPILPITSAKTICDGATIGSLEIGTNGVVTLNANNTATIEYLEFTGYGSTQGKIIVKGELHIQYIGTTHVGFIDVQPGGKLYYDDPYSTGLIPSLDKQWLANGLLESQTGVDCNDFRIGGGTSTINIATDLLTASVSSSGLPTITVTIGGNFTTGYATLNGCWSVAGTSNLGGFSPYNVTATRFKTKNLVVGNITFMASSTGYMEINGTCFIGGTVTASSGLQVYSAPGGSFGAATILGSPATTTCLP